MHRPTIKLLLTYYLNISVQAANIYQIAESNRKNRFGSQNRIESKLFLSELECSTVHSAMQIMQPVAGSVCCRGLVLLNRSGSWRESGIIRGLSLIVMGTSTVPVVALRSPGSSAL